MNQELINAIENHNIIEFDYEYNHHRVVEPHTYGLHKSTHNEVLSAFQIEGGSVSGGIPDWRLFEVSKISNLIVKNNTFLQTREGYNPDDSRMGQILAKA